ncbi:hypothetical protein C8R47DRAFT_1229850 [Mycena vitilis]|nr:hypothetical protein C8R47DRAFT_1229850 [Mycena vitilis]
MFAFLAAQSFHGRVLDRLYASPLCLLAECQFDRDFVRRVVNVVDNCESFVFVYPRTVDIFQPVLLGEISGIHYGGGGFKTIELKVPLNAGHRMDSFFWNQAACLDDLLAVLAVLRRGVILDDLIGWTVTPSDLHTRQARRRIYIDVSPSVHVRRTTPTRLLGCLDPIVSCSSDSLASSSTLSSSHSFVQCHETPPAFSVGDLVVVECDLRCRDYPSPLDAAQPTVIRVCSLSAVRLDVLV